MIFQVLGCIPLGKISFKKIEKKSFKHWAKPNLKPCSVTFSRACLFVFYFAGTITGRLGLLHRCLD